MQYGESQENILQLQWLAVQDNLADIMEHLSVWHLPCWQLQWTACDTLSVIRVTVNFPSSRCHPLSMGEGAHIIPLRECLKYVPHLLHLPTSMIYDMIYIYMYLFLVFSISLKHYCAHGLTEPRVFCHPCNLFSAYWHVIVWVYGKTNSAKGLFYSWSMTAVTNVPNAMVKPWKPC